MPDDATGTVTGRPAAVGGTGAAGAEARRLPEHRQENRHERAENIRPVRALATALVVAAAVSAAGAGLLAAGLPPAGRGDVAAAQAARWLGRYRYVASVIDLGRRRISAQCYHGWFRLASGRDVRGTLLRLEGRGWVRFMPPRSVRVDGRIGLEPLEALELAGCPSVLAPRLAAYALSHGIPVRAFHASGSLQLALRLRRLILYVSSRADVPLGVSLDGRRSVLRLTPFTRRLARGLRVSE